MCPLGTQIIHTQRLVLRPFTMADVRPMYTGWATDARVTQHLRWEPHGSKEVTREIVAGWVQSYQNPEYYHWAVTLAQSGELIGAIGVYEGEDERKLPEPGYCFAYRHWGQGFATETLLAVCEFMFDRVGAEEMVCCHSTENPASGACMEKVGFTYSHNDVYHKFDGTEIACRCYQLKKEDF